MALTTEQMKANVKALRDAGRPESVIDSYLEQSGVSQEYQQGLDTMKRFNESPIGKFMNKTDKVLGFVPRLLGFTGGKSPEEMLKKRFKDDVKGKNLLIEGLIDVAKEGGKGGIEAAQEYV